MPARARRQDPDLPGAQGEPLPAGAPPRPPTDLLDFIERFRAEHDLGELDAASFAEGLRDRSQGPDIAL